jgi:hypothetical protein
MSSGLKRKRPNKNVDRQYETVCRKYRVNFSQKLKKEEYKDLITLLEKESISADVASNILEHNDLPVIGRVSEIFPLAEIPRKIHTITLATIDPPNNLNLSKQPAVFLPDGHGSNLVHVVLPHSGDNYRLSRQAKVMIVLHKEEDLPYDMRKWDDNLARLYMHVIFSSNNGRSRIMEKDKNTLLGGYSPGNRSSLIQIRKVNPGLSRRQSDKINTDREQHQKRQDQMYKTMASMASESSEEGVEDFDKLIDLSYIENKSRPSVPKGPNIKSPMVSSGGWGNNLPKTKKPLMDVAPPVMGGALEVQPAIQNPWNNIDESPVWEVAPAAPAALQYFNEEVVVDEPALQVAMNPADE